jgi:hypothetical protein
VNRSDPQTLSSHVGRAHVPRYIRERLHQARRLHRQLGQRVQHRVRTRRHARWYWNPRPAATLSVAVGGRNRFGVIERNLNDPVRWRCRQRLSEGAADALSSFGKMSVQVLARSIGRRHGDGLRRRGRCRKKDAACDGERRHGDNAWWFQHETLPLDLCLAQARLVEIRPLVFASIGKHSKLERVRQGRLSLECRARARIRADPAADHRRGDAKPALQRRVLDGEPRRRGGLPKHAVDGSTSGREPKRVRSLRTL